ncbi:ATP-grasp domain-containing protein [Hyphococcus sp.]|uniref:ATP-grasp domain-containing protein n=1 Tax=Hyphococcus sp. TaxID=2038636 RepID=UPI0020858E3D|nr:MAG: ATP-grasp domain-containing protein [Marinicaulis sp.]
MKKNIVLATCREQQDYQASDAVFAHALEALGYAARPAPWNGDQAAFNGAGAVIIRSTWDYHHSPDGFARWLDGLEGQTQLFNAPELMRWNMSKRYLFELAECGAPVPVMLDAQPDAKSIAAAMDALGLDRAVIKPAYGATGSGLSLVARDDAPGLAAAARKLAGPGFVQALIPEITTLGETSLVFIAGDFSHAVTKRPKSGEILCQAEHGGSTEAAKAPDWAVEEAARILAMVPGEPLYARVDAVILDGGIELMEVELIEPELFFTYAPEGADRLAAALLERL